MYILVITNEKTRPRHIYGVYFSLLTLWSHKKYHCFHFHFLSPSVQQIGQGKPPQCISNNILCSALPRKNINQTFVQFVHFKIHFLLFFSCNGLSMTNRYITSAESCISDILKTARSLSVGCARGCASGRTAEQPGSWL